MELEIDVVRPDRWAWRRYVFIIRKKTNRVVRSVLSCRRRRAENLVAKARFFRLDPGPMNRIPRDSEEIAFLDVVRLVMDEEPHLPLLDIVELLEVVDMRRR